MTNVGLVQLAGVQPAHATFYRQLDEQFDAVTAPALPAGWTATRADGQQQDHTWETFTPGADGPGSVGVGAHGHVTDMILETPAFQAGAATTLLFYASYVMQATTGSTPNTGDAVDGVVLDIKIGTAAYVDLVAAGGSFQAGEGPSRRITTNQNNPLGGRTAWSGMSLGGAHHATLPSSANGQTVRLRWRLGTSKHTANQAGTNFFQPNAFVLDDVSVTTVKTDQTITFTSTAPFHAQAFTTYTPTATATSGLPVTFSIASGSVCSLAAGVVTFETPGPCTIQADQAGNGTFGPAPRATQGISVVKADQTVSFTSTAPENPQVGATYTPTASASSGGPITFSIAAGSSSVCSIGDANLVTFNAAGSCVIQADQVGNANLNPAPRVTQTVNVVAAPATDQTISFTSTAPVNPPVGATYTPTATATSGLNVSFSIAGASSAVCSIGGANLVTFNATGSCVIQADQAGNPGFNAAPQVTQSATVVAAAPVNQTISFTSSAPVNPPVGATYTPTATATSGLPVTFSIAGASSAVCSIGGANLVTFNATGSCVIQADQAGNPGFNAALRVTQSATVVKANQTISFTSSAPSNPLPTATYTPTATATSGLAVTFTIASSSSAECSIGGANLVTFNATGSCVIRANQAGNANFNAASQQTQNINVVAAAPTAQAISFTSTAPSNPPVGATYTPTATATSGLPVTFSIAGASSAVCSIGGANLVTFNAIGSCVIQANQAGNGSFNAAPQQTQSINVVASAPTAQAISFTSTAPSNPPVGATYTPTATATSGLPVTFSIAGASSAVCSIGGANLVTFNAIGSCVIQANQAGNGSFNAAPQQTQSINVVASAPTAQAISFTSTAPSNPPVGATYTPTATATSGLPVTFSIAGASSAVCSIGGANLVTFNAIGSCVIQADQVGNGSFNAAPQQTQSVTVVAAPVPVNRAWITGFTTSSLRNDFSGWVGSRLVVGPADVSVTALGRWVVAGNAGTHAVRLVNAAGTDVATATVDTAGAPAGAFKYTPLGGPVTLSAGATYYLLSQESAGGDSWYEYNLSTTTTGVAADTGAAWTTNATPGSINAGGSAGQSYGPSNLLYASTAPPAPKGTALVSSFTPGTARNDFSGWVGMRVTVGSSNLSVSALGRWAVGNDTGSHTVRLVNAATGAEVASVAVDVNGAPAGTYVYANLAAPVTLAANTTYYLLSQETMGGDRWYNYDTSTVTTSAASDIGVVYASNDSPNSFIVGGSPGQAFGPSNLLYTP